MLSKNDEKMTKAVDCLMDKISSDIRSDDALKYTQAALNIAHVAITLANLDNMDQSEKCLKRP